MPTKYKILALIGESGSGKDTIMQKVLELRPDLHEIVSCTSRPMREGEREGVNYYYYTPENFISKIEGGQMLEHTFFNNWHYGTSYDSVREDVVNVGVFNPYGIRQLIQRDDVELIVVYVRRSAKQRLLGQLNREDNPNVSEIVRRAAADEQDFAHLDFDHYTIDNEIYEDLVMAPARVAQLLDEFN